MAQRRRKRRGQSSDECDLLIDLRYVSIFSFKKKIILPLFHLFHFNSLTNFDSSSFLPLLTILSYHLIWSYNCDIWYCIRLSNFASSSFAYNFQWCLSSWWLCSCSKLVALWHTKLPLIYEDLSNLIFLLLYASSFG